jgi:hypothetical protein
VYVAKVNISEEMKVAKFVSLGQVANKPISKSFSTTATPAPKNIELEINGKKVKIRPGSTILQACATVGMK